MKARSPAYSTWFTSPGAFCAAPSAAHPDIRAYLSRHGGYLSASPGVMEALQHWAARHLS